MQRVGGVVVGGQQGVVDGMRPRLRDEAGQQDLQHDDGDETGQLDTMEPVPLTDA